jgi:RimJ/RimL family protein N-acetyltransferase
MLKRDTMNNKTSSKILFKSLEEADIAEIHRHQNTDCTEELSEILDNKPTWSPQTLGQIKDKLVEEQKKPHTAVFSMYADDKFIGIVEWSGSWDTWSPYAWFIIWPEHRRKGYGTQAAKMLLDRSFLNNPGHVASTVTSEWNTPAISFLQSMGFKDIGRMRRVGLKDGQYFDVLFFDILKSEYIENKKGVSQ